MSKEDRKIEISTDAIVLTEDNKIVIIKRKFEPFRGEWALPGGFIEYGETAEIACAREVKEETGLDFTIEKIIGVYSEPNRDPRGHIISICFIGKGKGEMILSDETTDIKAVSLDELKNVELMSDHNQMLKDAGFL